MYNKNVPIDTKDKKKAGHKMAKQVYFVIAVEFDENDNTTIAIDEERADAVMGDDSVWDTESAEGSSISDNEEIFEQATKVLKEKLGA